MYKIKRNGFTLVELMAVIIIISLIALLTFPNIINQIKKTKKSNNKMIENVITEQAKKYVSDNEEEFDSDEYCIPISTLMDNDYIKEELVKKVNYEQYIITMKENNYTFDRECKSNFIPPYYQKIEYLYSNGSAYIDTGVIPNNNTKIYIDMIPLSTSSNGYFGAFYTDSKDYRLINNGSIIFDNVSSRIIGSRINNNERYKIILDNYSISFEDKIVATGEATNIEFNKSIYIFRVNGLSEEISKVKVFQFKIYNGDEVIRDFIPVYNKKENIFGMYDQVEKKFYKNLGTSSFKSNFNIIDSSIKYTNKYDTVILKNQNIEDYELLEYIDFNSNQKINTDVMFNENLSFKVGIEPSGVTGVSFIGASGSEYNEFRLFNYQSKFYYDYDDERKIFGEFLANKYYDLEFGNYYLISDNDKLLDADRLYDVYIPSNIYLTGPAKYYYFKIYNNEELVRDFVPVKKLDSSRVGLYDKITNSFYML